MLQSLYQHRRYIVVNALNDMRHRHAGTVFGWLWVVLPPVAMITVYSAVFAGIMPLKALPAGGKTTSFALYLASGLLPWIAFTECLSRGASTFIDAAPYLRKLPIGEEVFVARVAASSVIVIVVSLAVLAVASALLGSVPGPTWLLALPVALLFCALGFGLACVLAVLNVFFRDIGQGLHIILQIWMWLLPIVYVEDVVPDFLQRMFWYNPVYPFIRAFHDLLVHGQVPSLGIWAAMVAWAVAALTAGVLFVQAHRPEVRDAI